MKNEIKSLIEKYDTENLLTVLKNSFRQIEYIRNYDFETPRFELEKINKIIISGMGGSASGADVLRNFISGKFKVPYSINRNYYFNELIDENTLVIVSSYSGNTEESLSALEIALENRAKIVCVTTGGAVGEIASSQNLPVFWLEKGYQPRYAFYMSLFALLKILDSMSLIRIDQGTFDKSVELLKSLSEEYLSDENEALTISEKIDNRIPIIYSIDGVNDSVGYRFKCQLNENSKLHAFSNVFPEMNHNEIVGWETASSYREMIIPILISDIEVHERIKSRIQIFFNEILENENIIRISSRFGLKEQRILNLIFLTDWISYYSAIIRGYDPGEIDNIHYLKKRLTESNFI